MPVLITQFSGLLKATKDQLSVPSSPMAIKPASLVRLSINIKTLSLFVICYTLLVYMQREEVVSLKEDFGNAELQINSKIPMKLIF